jgi:hypothetical protein
MRRHVLVLGAVVAACGLDPTTPVNDSTSVISLGPLSVTFSVEQTSAGHHVGVNGANYWACDFAFSMQAAAAAAADYVLLTDGEIDYRLGANGATYTQLLVRNDLEDWFGTDQLGEGGTETARQVLSSTGPFTAKVFFRCLDAGPYSAGASHTALGAA